MEAAARRFRLRSRTCAILAVIVVLMLFVGYAGISILSAHVLTRSLNQSIALDPSLVGPHPQHWEARTADEITLRGWYFPTREHRRLVVCVHGMTEDWTAMAGLGHDLRRLGYDVLLFDLRGHGSSDPARLTMGRRETADLRRAGLGAPAGVHTRPYRLGRRVDGRGHRAHGGGPQPRFSRGGARLPLWKLAGAPR